MNLVYSDSSSIDALSLKKMMLTADKLIFVDRPSIQFQYNVGTVGVKSNLRGLEDRLSNEVLSIKTIEPPNSVFNSDFYHKYFEIDQNNIDFRKNVISEIISGWNNFFLVNSKANGPSILGQKNLGEWIKKNQNMILNYDLDNLNEVEPKNYFNLNTEDDVLRAFRTILWENSLLTTSVLHSCNLENANPISISPFIDNSIKIRLSDSNYIGDLRGARSMGKKLIEMFISDEALNKMEFNEILNFRKETDDIYKSYITEINKIEANLFRQNEKVDAIYIMDTIINPELERIRKELIKARDLRFKKFANIINNGFFSVIAAGTLSFVNLPAAVIGFVSSHLKSPKLTQEIIEEHFKIKDLKKDSNFTYLLKLKRLDKKKLKR